MNAIATIMTVCLALSTPTLHAPAETDTAAAARLRNRKPPNLNQHQKPQPTHAEKHPQYQPPHRIQPRQIPQPPRQPAPITLNITTLHASQNPEPIPYPCPPGQCPTLQLLPEEAPLAPIADPEPYAEPPQTDTAGRPATTRTPILHWRKTPQVDPNDATNPANTQTAAMLPLAKTLKKAPDVIARLTDPETGLQAEWAKTNTILEKLSEQLWYLLAITATWLILKLLPQFLRNLTTVAQTIRIDRPPEKP